MASLDGSLLDDFKNEAHSLLKKMILILEQCEGDLRLAPGLEEYGQLVDRIMGGAQSLVMGLESSSEYVPLLEQVGHYSAICKAVGYKTSQLKDKAEFYDICIAFLMDATEVLDDMTNNLFDPDSQKSHFLFNQTFIERLKWVNDQFGNEYRSSVAVKSSPEQGRMNQSDIDDLLKKLGIG